MALRFIDGFDHYAAADITQKWPQSATGTQILSGAARTGGFGCRLNGGNQPIVKTIDSQATWIVGFAYRAEVAQPIDNPIIQFKDTISTLHVDLRINAAGHFYFTRNGTQLGSVWTYTFPVNQYIYIEVKVTISDTVGVAVLKINGVTDINLSSQDTRNAGNSTADTIYLGGASNSGSSLDYDDVYICDGTGGSNNDFLGDCKVETLVPTGAGNSTQWTPSTGSNWQNVDDAAPNGDTDYNSDGTVSDKDTYAMSNLATTSGTVFGVQEIWSGKKDDAGSRSVHGVVRSGSSESNGADISLNTSYVQRQDMFETKPGGGAWSISDVNAMEAGVAVAA
jgi:hypothetical protein